MGTGKSFSSAADAVRVEKNSLIICGKYPSCRIMLHIIDILCYIVYNLSSYRRRILWMHLKRNLVRK